MSCNKKLALSKEIVFLINCVVIEVQKINLKIKFNKTRKQQFNNINFIIKESVFNGELNDLNFKKNIYFFSERTCFVLISKKSKAGSFRRREEKRK